MFGFGMLRLKKYKVKMLLGKLFVNNMKRKTSYAVESRFLETPGETENLLREIRSFDIPRVLGSTIQGK